MVFLPQLVVSTAFMLRKKREMERFSLIFSAAPWSGLTHSHVDLSTPCYLSHYLKRPCVMQQGSTG